MRTAVCGRCRVGAGAGQPVPTTSGLCQNSVPPGACTRDAPALKAVQESTPELAGKRTAETRARAKTRTKTLAFVTEVKCIL